MKQPVAQPLSTRSQAPMDEWLVAGAEKKRKGKEGKGRKAFGELLAERLVIRLKR